MKLFFQLVVLVLLTSIVTFGAMYWLDQPEVQPPAAPLAAVPETMQSRVALVTAKGCPACHSLDGQDGVGPTWVGSWGQTREFTDGSRSVFDAAYFRESVLNPGARVVKGFQNVMIPAPLTEEELLQIQNLLMQLGNPVQF